MQVVAPVAYPGRRDLHRARLAHRQGEIHDRVARRLRQVQRRRLVGLVWQRERRAVLEHTRRLRQRKTPGRQQVAIHRHLRQAPGMGPQRRGALARQRLQPAVLLLEMLRAQEHAFLPDHAVGPRHGVGHLRSEENDIGIIHGPCR